jgi:putative heme-binding domain-containing protein
MHLPSRLLWTCLALGTSLVAPAESPVLAREPLASDPARLFARDNLVAWCIVPFDGTKRGPEARAAMLETLGFRHFAYDWRGEHIPTFDLEVEALKKHGVQLDAFWSPGELNADSQRILDLLARHKLHTQLWVLLDVGNGPADPAEQERRVAAAVAKLRPLAQAANQVGCSLALYNHGGWFGEPENQISIVKRLENEQVHNVGIVYNLHHGHAHLDRLPEILGKLKPYLRAINLNGMDRDGEQVGRKILPLGQGELDLAVLRAIVASGYQGPIGILGHTQDDAEARLLDNLDGLAWLLPQLEGKPAGPRPTLRTPVPPRPAKVAETEGNPVGALLLEARSRGDARAGAAVFSSSKYACVSCHKIGAEGGAIGPELSTVGVCLKPEELVEAVLQPSRKVAPTYVAVAVELADGTTKQGYRDRESATELVLRDPASGTLVKIPRNEVVSTRELGTLMPAGLLEAMTPVERRDLIRFLLDLGKPGSSPNPLLGLGHTPSTFTYTRDPLEPAHWPSWRHQVNRDRLYDFYTKEALAYVGKSDRLLPAYPGLDGGTQGHWGNQSEATWTDDRWNRTDLGRVLAGVFRGAGVTVPKGVCVRLGDRGEVAACFDPQTLQYPAAWRGGFLKFSPTRHGFLNGLILDGTPLPKPDEIKHAGPITYHGYYRHGERVVFSYAVAGVEWLDAPWAEDGEFRRIVAPVDEHTLKSLTHGGPALWPQIFETKGKLGTGVPYAIDSIEPPFVNPWNALMFFGGHDFLPDGTAFVCTMQGDVWRVEGLDAGLEHVRWNRFASGLHQALGLKVVDGKPCVLGRDQITRLHDLNEDGEADFYECVSNIFPTSPSGHDFLCGLERDGDGRFLIASSQQGVIRVSADGKTYENLATGLRNPDGLGLSDSGVITVPSSEGEWVPASMVAEVRPGGHYGYRGPRGNQPPDLPLVYLPRGLDNSSGGQVFAPRPGRFGPLDGQLIHLSFGAGAHFLILRDQVDGQPQGAVVPLPGEFLSGAHRGRFNPRDGQLYVSGMAGWGSYTPLDGSLERVRYTGARAQLPVAFEAHEDGVRVTFSEPLDPAYALKSEQQFAQAWNYRYSAGYGSQELSPSHPGVAGHDRLEVRSTRIEPDGRTLFVELPEIQPVNQLHLHLKIESGPGVDIFATVHRLRPPVSASASSKTIAAHPIFADMMALSHPPAPNPWQAEIPGARRIRIEAGKNLSFEPRLIRVRAGEPIRLVFVNPDAVPHNWALIRPGTLARVGDQVNRLIAQPDAVARRYVPDSADVLAYTDIAEPQGQVVISFRAPTTPGKYPYLCTFPGHWMVMNGELVVE